MATKLSKANPLWDGDGVQGVGQPRNPKNGKWVDTGGAIRAVGESLLSSAHPDTKALTSKEKRMEKWAKTKSLVDLKDGKGRFEKFLRRNLDKIGIDPYDVDWKKLDKHASDHAKAMKLDRNMAGESQFWFKSPCWTIRDVDFCVHVLLPAMMEDKYPKRAKQLKATSPRWKGTNLVRKGFNPLWDGDGLQGAGQPRDRRGRWIGLPGPTSIKRIGAFDLDDGTIGIYIDNERRPIKTYKSKSAANKMVANAIKEDASAFAEQKKANANRQRRVNREKKKADAAMAVSAAEEAKSRKAQEAIFGPRKKRKAKPEGVEQAGPKPRSIPRRVKVSELDALPNPGSPTPAQVKEAKDWARRELPDNEAKYSGLILRLLVNRGKTQDPKIRGDMSRRYDIPAGRLVQIEQDTYSAMFPQGSAKRRPPNLAGSSTSISPLQVDSMKRLGARLGIPEAEPNNPNRPERYFKITAGPKRGRWAKVAWNGDVTLVTKKEGEKAKKESNVWWTAHLLRTKAASDKLRAARSAAGNDKNVRNESLADRKNRRIRIAQKWAESEGYDPSDSYWWAIFWGDPSLLKQQREDATDTINIVLADPVISRRMDPSLLEGMLAMPDIDSRNMRGHRPGPKKSQPGDEDFEEASALSRTVDPEWESKNRDREMSHQRRMRAAYNRYKAKYPNTKMSLSEFSTDYFNNKIRIPGGKRVVRKAKNPLWDGDGVQGVGQPRGKGGKWSRAGALSTVAGELMELGSMQHTKTTGSNRRSTGPSGVKISPKKPEGLPLWDAKNKRSNWYKPPQKGSKHQSTVGGVTVKKKKTYAPEQAYYLRNNGPTKITNKRLKEIFEDRSKATAQEFDLINSAKGDGDLDGNDPITINAVGGGGGKRTTQRWMLIKNLKTNMTQDFAKSKGLAVKGSGGQILVHGAKDKRAQKQRSIDNKKRAGNQRHQWRSRAALQSLLDDFGDGKKAKCIICGRNVSIDEVSPERMKPERLKGIYDKGNVAPAHESCNRKMNTFAQFKPEEYYADSIEKFLKYYGPQIKAGKLRYVFGKHRGKLRGRG